MLEALDTRPGRFMLEIGTGTGWNAALLSHCVGEHGRVISTASIREVVPPAWLDQLRPAGWLVTPRGTDWSNGVMLTLNLVLNHGLAG